MKMKQTKSCHKDMVPRTKPQMYEVLESEIT